jgi:hypothetical protein
MKTMILTAVLLVAAPAFATGPAVTTPAPSTPAAPAVAATSPSIEMPIEALVADPRAKAVLEANMPGISTHPMYDSFKGMTISQLAPMSQGKISDAAIAKLKAALAAIK